jgi:tyramine---L-glutamate ligase
MRLFVYEWSCCAQFAPASLRREGWAMLAAVVSDFLRSPDIQVVTLVHESLAQKPPGEICRLATGQEEEMCFRNLAAGADATLVIAPETGNVLRDRARWVEQVGGRLLGSTSAAIALTADKFRCGQWLRKHKVPTPPARRLEDDIVYPAVLKPRDGAGSLATFLIRDATELAESLQRAAAEGQAHDFIVQDYVPGQAASIVFLVGPRACVPLPPAFQLLSTDGQFRYLGGTVPLPPALAARATALGRRAIEAVPELRGYVGIDLVLGDAADGSNDWVIEINPRWTTSYLGLRRLACDNLAHAMLQVALGEEVATLRWREETVHFAAEVPDATSNS